jgi:hypothetical protein
MYRQYNSTPPNKCINYCIAPSLPDAAGTNQYICDLKCNNSGTYKYRDILSTKLVCVTLCSSQHWYQTNDSEFVCLPTASCPGSITNDR